MPISKKGDTAPDNLTEEVIYRMTICKNGKIIRRKNGRPFKLVIRHPKSAS